MKKLFTFLVILAVIGIFWYALRKTKELPPIVPPVRTETYPSVVEETMKEWPCDLESQKCP